MHVSEFSVGPGHGAVLLELFCPKRYTYKTSKNANRLRFRHALACTDLKFISLFHSAISVPMSGSKNKRKREEKEEAVSVAVPSKEGMEAMCMGDLRDICRRIGNQPKGFMTMCKKNLIAALLAWRDHIQKEVHTQGRPGGHGLYRRWHAKSASG